MSFRFKLFSWIVAVNLVITGLLLWAILSNIHTQSIGYRDNAERFAEQREEIIRRLEDILIFQERMALKKPGEISPGTILQWEEWPSFRDAMVRLDYMERFDGVRFKHNMDPPHGEIVPVNILLNPLGKQHRSFDDDRALNILDIAIREDRLVLQEDEEDPDRFYIAIPIHFGTDVLPEGGEDGNPARNRIWGGALVQPKFPVLEAPKDYFDWKLFWAAMVGGTSILMFVTYVILSRLVIHPVEELAQTADSVAHGDYSARCASMDSKDEIGKLIRSFNFMVSEVRDYHKLLEERIDEAQARVQMAERHLIIAQRLTATGKLAAGIAHEINNPIGGMINAALSLKERSRLFEDDKRAVIYIDLIIEGLERIKDIVRKVLIFTPRSLKPDTVYLLDILRDAEALVDYKLRKEEIEFSVAVEPEDLMVYCEPGELRQVFLNLYINSLDAVERGKGRISVSAGITADHSFVFVDIIDNGCGMGEEALSHAFDLFYTTKEAGKGTGLGLSVAHNIIENHGGIIEVSSAKGKGTSIRILLPNK
ncbi:MAG: ATP-binding protein [Planctomycetota bacterium]